VELSQKLKELRKKQGLTQLELAERLFVSRQAISGWEAGTSRPSTENLQSLSRLFNIPLETLLDDTAEAEPAAAQEKLPAEEQAKEEDKGQGKARRYKAIVLVIVLLAILLTTAVLAHRRTA
jgi:transcriptional regulator with XRE-family HTH domain